jgi:flagellar motor switch protein FliM
MADENPAATPPSPPPAAPAENVVPARAAPATSNVQPYDFRQPAFLSASDLRKLKLRQEEFARSLSTRLSNYLRLECTLTLASLRTITYQKFIEGLATPTHLTLFKVEPLRGICVLEIMPRLGLTIVDRLLGGPAQAANSTGDLSEIEVALLDQAVQIILSEWCNQWISIQEVRPVLLGHENNGRFLQTASHDNVMLSIAVEARMGDCTEKFQIGFPYYTIEPLLRHLSVNLAAHGAEKVMPAPPMLAWNPQFDGIQVEVTAEWNGLELPAREVARLKVGDIVQLHPQTCSRVQLRLSKQPKFVGRLGTRGNKWAVELAQVLHSEPGIETNL